MLQLKNLRIINKIAAIVAISAEMVAIVSCGNGSTADENDIYSRIDEEIEKADEYDAIKESRINQLKERLEKENRPEIKREITDLLILEYESYISDSALHYINLNLINPTVVENKERENRLLIKKADVAAHAGLFGESLAILKSLSTSSLDSTLFEEYYNAYCDLLQYQSEYATNSEYGREHEAQRQLYIDSISAVASPGSINFVVYAAAEKARNGRSEEAEEMLKETLKKYKSGDRTYSIISSILADIYKRKGDKANFEKYIGESVISDIKGSVKENMAIRALATECYEKGDLERADKYLRQSFSDANFYSARMRNAQSSRMLPVIGEAFTSQQKDLNHKLRLLVIFISILAFGFILISIFSVFQVKKIRKVNKRTKEMLEDVSVLSAKLSEVNKELSEANADLHASDKIKEEYAVLFMEYCSLAISSLQHYQQSLKVTSAQGNLPLLVKKINSGVAESKTLAEFYSKFDEAILHIYPNFVENFNNLLLPEERVVLKPREGLNTELRVFALIRLGFHDPEKIAKFLRCSLTTVYTYRSKMKKRALNPETFEDDLMKI